MPRIATILLIAVLAAAVPARASEIWVAPTHQQDLGGLGVGSNGVWPATAAGVVRLAWGIPSDLRTFQSARLVLIPEAAAPSGTLTFYVCRAQAVEIVSAACTGPHAQAFSSTANQLLEIDISTAIAAQIGSSGKNHVAVLAYATPTTTTDRIVGLRFIYAPVLPAGAATLAANTFTGAQTAPAFVGDGAGLTNVAKLGANTFTGTQHAPSFSGSGHLLTNVAKLGDNSFTGVQSLLGSLDLRVNSYISSDGTKFIHSRTDGTFVGLNAGINVGNQADFNTGIGNAALTSTTTGEANTAVGHDALVDNTTGSDNTGVGYNALKESRTGTANTAVGNWALAQLATGNFNTAIGNGAGTNLVDGLGNIYVNNPGFASESWTTRIGSGQERAFIAGVRGVQTGFNNAVALLVDSAGQLGTISSSRRYKEDIHDMDDASRRLSDLRPVTFRYSKPFGDGGKPMQYGLIAEEVAQVFPELVVRDDEGRPETVQYHTLNVLLLNELQRLQKRVEELERRLGGGVRQ